MTRFQIGEVAHDESVSIDQDGGDLSLLLRDLKTSTTAAPAPDDSATTIPACLKVTEKNQDSPEPEQQQPSIYRLIPEPGFVIKTRFIPDENPEQGPGQGTVAPTTTPPQPMKLFINVCQSPEIPAPPPISEEEWVRVLETQASDAYRVPMSVGGPMRSDRDQAGRECRVVDVAVHTRPLSMAESDEGFRAFLMELTMSWLEQKFHILISRSDVTLPKMKSKGTLVPHTIRRPKRRIVEAKATTEDRAGSMKQQLLLTTEMEPQYEEWIEPISDTDDRPAFVVLTLQLPKLTTCMKTATLEVTSNQMIFHAPQHYHLVKQWDTSDIQVDEVTAQFDRGQRSLTITLPME